MRLSMATEETEKVCKLGASVPTGLEVGAAEECAEVLGRPPVHYRGRLAFTLNALEELKKVDNLRSVDNFWVVVGEFPGFCIDEPSVLERLLTCPQDGDLPQWDVALRAWQYYRTTILGADPASWSANPSPLNTDHTSSDPNPAPSDDADPTSSDAGSLNTDPTPSNPDPSSPPRLSTDPSPAPRPITFRVTATRGGRKHCFTSMEAAAHLGAGLSRRYGWKVQMKEADLEVLLAISGDDMSVSLALNRESKFKRNLSHFGPTSLRSTIAHGLLRTAGIQPGDVVVDPLCGGGSISIEGGLGWSTTFHLAGDNHDLAPPRTRANLRALEEKGVAPLVDVFQWDAGRLPLKTSSVDVVVTDLPFGKKSGTLQANWILYPRVLMELGRVCRPGSARAVLLTHDNKAFSRALQRNELWKRKLTRWVNVGGLTAAIFLLTRTSTLSK